MRPLFITDGAHLKGTYKGTNLVLFGMDGNNQIVPIATCVSQGEIEESWTWFFLMFKECIGEDLNLAIIMDRHPAIIFACNTIFPNAFHGYWCRHLMMYCKMKSEKLQLSGIPSGHVIAVSRKIRCTDCSHLALGWFRRTTLYSTYQDLVYPVEEPSSWDSTQPRLKRSRQIRQESNIHVDLGRHSQEYEAAHTNNYVRSQEYKAEYTNNYVRSQEYEATYTNNYVRSQEYEAAFNNMDGGSQGYEADYTNFNSMFEQANINFGGQSQHPLPTTPFTFIQFNLGQSSQQTYSTWDSSSWDPVNLADP
uniref:Transposase, MuDR, MULE transposase domain protein n=1 Tax=Tanacetum cinerariifolium TaxID=118510 RepID=A0A699JI99_TANCI|nr:transposase, MuDR, MULE transposase domain protein [Tanacetum cinerariifolium]